MLKIEDLKIGRIVRIRKDLKNVVVSNDSSYRIAKSMLDHAGEIAKITDYAYNGAVRLNVGEAYWGWTHEMLEKPTFVLEEIIKNGKDGQLFVNTCSFAKVEKIKINGDKIEFIGEGIDDVTGISRDRLFTLQQNIERIYYVEFKPNGDTWEYRSDKKLEEGDLVKCNNRYGKIKKIKEIYENISHLPKCELI